MVYKKDSSQSFILNTARMRNLFMPQLLFLLINASEGLCSLRVYISRGKIDAVCLSMLQRRHILCFLCFLLSKCPPLFSKLILQLKCDQQHHCKESKGERIREKFLSLASICPFFFTLKLRDTLVRVPVKQAYLLWITLTGIHLSHLRRLYFKKSRGVF